MGCPLGTLLHLFLRGVSAGSPGCHGFAVILTLNGASRGESPRALTDWLLSVARPELRLLVSTARDLAPIVLVVTFFQLAVLHQPFPNLVEMLVGLAVVLIGLALFVRGLEMALFPIGEALAGAFARKGNMALLLLFAFALGFGTTVAEPALIAVTEEASRIMAAEGVIVDEESVRSRYAVALRYTVAASVGTAISVGVLRILRGWSLPAIIITGYVVVVVLTAFAPKWIVGIAYDSGGVTTSTVTVPLVTALGVGLAMATPGRNPMIDGFGLIAFASISPMIFLLIFGMVV